MSDQAQRTANPLLVCYRISCRGRSFVYGPDEWRWAIRDMERSEFRKHYKATRVMLTEAELLNEVVRRDLFAVMPHDGVSI